MNQTSQQTSGNQETSAMNMGGEGAANQKINGKTSSQPWDQRSEEQQHSEGTVAKTIEDQTAKLPSDTFLWAAVGAMGVSAIMEFSGHKDKSRFIGQWVAPLLLFGVYNKLVKIGGSDRTEN